MKINLTAAFIPTVLVAIAIIAVVLYRRRMQTVKPARTELERRRFGEPVHRTPTVRDREPIQLEVTRSDG